MPGDSATLHELAHAMEDTRAAIARAQLRRFDHARFDSRPKRKPRPKRIPGNAARKVKAPKLPTAIEMMFVLALRRAAARFGKAVLAVVMPRVADFAKQPSDDDDARTDAKGPNDAAANVLLRNMKAAAKGSLGPGVIKADSARAAAGTLKHSQKEFKRLGIDVRKEPMLTPLMDGWQKDNVSLITNMHAEQLGKVDTILRDGFGRRPESLAKDIERQLDDVSKSRAELIARDQVLTLNAKITRHRQKSAGIEKYVWTTSNDERVRDEHAALEGEVFAWDEGGDPEEGHPGEAINCRCVAFPILDELDDEDPGEDE